MTNDLRQLRIRQLDSALGHYRSGRDAPPPRRGWIREIRQAIGMTAAQLAKRLRIKQPTLSKLEASEATGTITLNSLRKAAHALDCELVYALVPRSTLQEQLMERVQQIAHDRVSRVAHTMRLENQDVADEHLQRQVDELVQRMLNDPPRNLWA